MGKDRAEPLPVDEPETRLVVSDKGLALADLVTGWSHPACRVMHNIMYSTRESLDAVDLTSCGRWRENRPWD